ncbi:hypothetical protein MRB53_038546 [Persea americana]|nr:hypothetical protein MRB53_038546 [Persea americana]
MAMLSAMGETGYGSQSKVICPSFTSLLIELDGTDLQEALTEQTCEDIKQQSKRRENGIGTNKHRRLESMMG